MTAKEALAAIRAEIERLRKIDRESFKKEHITHDIFHGRNQVENHLLSFIESLEKEQDVDFDFQRFSKEMDALFALPASQTENTAENPLNWEYAISRHFYELGRNAK